MPTLSRKLDECKPLDTGPLVADCVMWATGRVPNTDRPSLGLEEVGVELDSKGAIVVNEYSQTTAVPHRYRAPRRPPNFEPPFIQRIGRFRYIACRAER